MSHVLQEDSRFDDPREIQFRSCENGLQVFKDAMSLIFNAACDQLPGCGINGYLPGSEYHVADANCLGVGPDGGWRLRGVDGCSYFAHIEKLYAARSRISRAQ